MKKSILIIALVICLFTQIGYLFSAETAVSEIFLKRHSGKNFDPFKEVSFDQIHTLVEATRWTPSSYNDQPWSFIICDRNTTPTQYETAMSSLYGDQDSWARNAPLLIIVTARTKFEYNNKPNDWAEYDTGAAAMSLSLQATELGLMAHQIGGFDRDVIQEEFKLPEDQIPLTLIAVGYESSEPDPDESPRERKELSENFFLGGWGVSVKF